MLGLRRRKKIEGWALDLPDGDGEVERAPLARRVLDSNKAWVICLAGIVLLTFFFVKHSNRTMGPKAPVIDPLKAPSEFRDRGRYTRFETEFRTDKRFAESVIGVKFLTPGRLQIVVPGGMGADEIDYIAKMAAERVKYVFSHRTVVYVYKISAKNNARMLVATARWEPAKHGYLVRFYTVAE